MSIKKKSIFRSAIKHTVIMFGVCIAAVLGLYLVSRNALVTLHPNAYRDIVRSIVIVYAIFFVSSILVEYLLNRYIIGDSKEDEKFSLKEYFERVTLYETVGISFTLLTVFNSIMMLTGVDVPKEGAFAYIHLMMRLGIITLIVILISLSYIKDEIKNFDIGALSVVDVLYAPKKDAFISISKAFTNASIVYCFFMISFQGYFSSLGGSGFYISLLLGLGVISFARIITLGIK